MKRILTLALVVLMALTTVFANGAKEAPAAETPAQDAPAGDGAETPDHE